MGGIKCVGCARRRRTIAHLEKHLALANQIRLDANLFQNLLGRGAIFLHALELQAGYDVSGMPSAGLVRLGARSIALYSPQRKRTQTKTYHGHGERDYLEAPNETVKAGAP